MKKNIYIYKQIIANELFSFEDSYMFSNKNLA